MAAAVEAAVRGRADGGEPGRRIRSTHGDSGNGPKPGTELARFVDDAVRRQRGGVAPVWDELVVRELPSLPSMSPSLSSRRHRFDLLFSVGPLSNQYPTTSARALMAELPRRLELAFIDDILDGRAQAAVVSEARFSETADEEGDVTLVVEVPVTVYLRF